LAKVYNIFRLYPSDLTVDKVNPQKNVLWLGFLSAPEDDFKCWKA